MSDRFDHIRKLAITRAGAQLYATTLAMKNGHKEDIADQIAFDAQYQLARDAAFRADADYRKAVNELDSADLMELARSMWKP